MQGSEGRGPASGQNGHIRSGRRLLGRAWPAVQSDPVSICGKPAVCWVSCWALGVQDE